MQIQVLSEVLIVLFLSNLSWKVADTHTIRLRSGRGRENDFYEDNKISARSMKRNKQNEQNRAAVSEEEISYIASTLEPRECLSLLYLLHHAYKRRRRREIEIEKYEPRSLRRSAQISPCQTMLLNHWRDPRFENEKNRFQISRTLRQVNREDLARWLCDGEPSCFSKTIDTNGTIDSSSLQVIPIYSSDTRDDRPTTESNLDAMIWIYIALAVCATASFLFCVNYLFNKFRKSAKYTTIADKDFTCRCDKRLSLSSCNKKKRYQLPREPLCGCSGN